MFKKHELVGRCNDGRLSNRELESVRDHGRKITLRTFARHVDVAVVAADLGYAHGRHAKGMHLADEGYIQFNRSKFRGKPCYHLVWSCIDHVYQGQA